LLTGVIACTSLQNHIHGPRESVRRQEIVKEMSWGDSGAVVRKGADGPLGSAFGGRLHFIIIVAVPVQENLGGSGPLGHDGGS
jgi:hypothetical protein